MQLVDEWKHEKTDIFWGEIAPCDHVMQIYENDEVFLDTLTGFVGSGINAGESVIVIASAEHLQSLYDRLTGCAVNVKSLVEEHRYIPLDAEKTLAMFMRDDWPDEKLFNKTISEVIEKGLIKGRRIRAFGEMVALLWEKGLNGATVHLEHLWNKFCARQKFALFCAYPKAGFTQDINASINKLCACHSKIIHRTEKKSGEVFYAENDERKVG
jgi:hypothetical protein